MRIPEETLGQLRQRAAIDEIAARYTHLVPAARGESKGCCPLPDHDERTPSFYVNPAAGVFHCFGCGRGGDVLTFLELVEQLTFREAALQLAEQLGIPIPDGPGQRTDAPAGTPKLLRNALQIAADTYTAALRDDPSADAARHHLADRGFTADHIRVWGIGYAPRARASVLAPRLTAAHLPTAVGIDAGLVREGRTGQPYDTFAGRLIWPLRDPQGRIVGLAGRSLDDPTVVNPDRYRKYVNSDDSVLFRKSNILFGLASARPAIVKHRRVIVVEGYTDVMAVVAAGHPEVVGVCGTAFTATHARLLSRLLGPDGEIVVMLDADDAGQAAAWKIAVACHQFATVTLAVPGELGSDPCQLRADHGDHAVRDAITARQPLIRQVLARLLAAADTPERAAVAARRAAALLDELADPVLVLRYRRWVADQLGIPTGQPQQSASTTDVSVTDPTPLHRLDCIRDLAAQLVDDPTLWERLALPNELVPADLLPARYATVVEAAASSQVGGATRWEWLLSAAEDDTARAAVTALMAGRPEMRDPRQAAIECARAFGPTRLAALRAAMATGPDAVAIFTRSAAGLSQLSRW